MKHLLLPALLLLAVRPARAAAYVIDWLDMSSTPLAGAVTSPSSTYMLPGYGNVQVTYTSSSLNWTRNQSAPMQNGSFVAGADTYAWTTRDSMDAVNFGANGTAVDYTVTFTLLNGTMPAGRLVLGTAGLGHTSSAGFTHVRVLQNGTFLNDWDLGANFGPTAITLGPGLFDLTNSLAEPTPGFFNSDLGVTRVDDALTSLTLQIHHIGQDGIGVNIGMINPVPEPASTAFLGMGAAFLLRRRRGGSGKAC